MFPGLPSSLSGAYVLGGTDQDVQARTITRLGKPFGLWYDDTTPDLNKWVAAGLAKAQAENLEVMVCVPPGRPHHHYPAPIISAYERYTIGMSVPESAWGPCPRFDAYVVQHNYPGTVGKKPPTIAQRARLRAEVQAMSPRFIWLF